MAQDNFLMKSLHGLMGVKFMALKKQQPDIWGHLRMVKWELQEEVKTFCQEWTTTKILIIYFMQGMLDQMKISF